MSIDERVRYRTDLSSLCHRQDALMSIDERVRADLLAGRGLAEPLTEANLQQIDNVYKLVTPNHEQEQPIKVGWGSSYGALGCLRIQ